ncbi:hypothetical protein OSTOST_07137, partial [Ostertagia ostertagi]
PQTHPCTRCDAWNVPASLTLLLLLFFVSTVLTMYKVLRSYSKKAERKQEVSRAADRNGHVSSGNYYDEGGHHFKGQNGHAANGQLLAVDNRHLSNAYAGQAFSESSSYETREHFERKVQRVKKTRGERERSRSSRRGEEVSEALHASDASSARDALLQWARKVTSGYPRVNVTNFSSSWKDGLAFNAILHRYRPNLIDWNKVSDSSVSNRERLENAFAAAEREFGVDRLLDAQDVDTDHPDEKSIITYVSSLYNALPHLPELSKFISMQEQYIVEARAWMELVERATRLIDDETDRFAVSPTESLMKFEKYRDECMADRAREYNRLMEEHEILRRHLSGTDHFCVPRNLTGHALTEAWSNLTYLNDHKLTCLRQKIIQSNLADLISRLSRGIGITNEKLDLILTRVVCNSLQAEVSAEDTYEYCELLRVLESEYQQLRDLSAGRMLDLVRLRILLIAFVRAAQMELVWVSEREEIEVTRNWSDVKQLDLPMLTNYYKQLLHEMELREKQYNDVHNQGAALLNQGHPAVHVIEVYLRTMQNQWDWLLALSKCLEEHLRDALNLKSFTEKRPMQRRGWKSKQYDWKITTTVPISISKKGERLLRELDEMKEILNKYHSVLMALTERCATISPLWQRGERISRPITVTALCDYSDKTVHIKAGAFVRGWDLDTFNAIDPEQRDAIMRALNDDANKLLAEMDPNDPLALRLKEELRRTNEHFWDLLNASQKPPEPDHAHLFDGQIGELLRKLEDAWRKLNDNAGKPISRSPAELETVIMNHKSFEDALQVLESVLNGILEVSDIVKAHEITLNSFDDLPAALDKLRGHHSQLLEMNMVLQQQQTVIDSLNKNVALLRQHVARTRIGQSSHPDVDRLEDEVQQLNVRWENVCTQVAERLKAAERALQTQMVYRSEYENEMAWLDRVEETINKLRKPEELRPEQYQQQLDLLVAEYAQLQERTEAIENVNREGGKFIREAKGYDSRMGQFHDSIVGIHGPAVKQEFRRTKPQPKNGAQIVTEELEALNRRFAQLSSLILERRNTMQVLIQNWKRQKQEEDRRRRQREKDDEDRRRREEEERRRREEEEKRRKQMPPLNIVQGSQIHEVVGQENPDEFEVIGDLPGVAKITEHEDEMQMYQEETVTKTQFYEMEGTLHKQTGEILTFVEAVRQGLLDLSAGGGQFFDIHSGRISLEKAVELGYIDGAFNDVLNTRYGLYDPQTRHLYDIHTGEMLELYDWVAHKIVTMDTQRRLVKMGILKLPPMALHSAIDQGVLNTVSGHFVGKYSHESMPIRDALYHGYLQLVSAQQIPMIAITLSDAIKQGFINANNGEFVDKNTKDTFTLREACSKQFGLLNLYVPEIVNTAENTRLNLKDAMLRNAINTRNGNFTDLQNATYVVSPRGVPGGSDLEAVFTYGNHRHTILEAIAAGLLDAEVRHIVDPDEKDVISIAEAMERGILSADGKIILEKQQKEFTIPEANTRTGQTMSFNEACEAGAIIPNAERVVDLATQDSYLISDQKATSIIDQTLHELLVKPLGIRGDRGDYDLNLVRAVSKGIVDHTKAVFFNKSTKHEMTPREAYDAGLISLRGAIQAAALFDVSPSLIAPVKKVEHKKRVSRPGQPGLIDPSSEWIVPSKSNGVGPTIEEKTTESVTETGQQLAPKFYPDKNIEESVTTVKRVRTTETTALGGPGGVSVYRAITGGKGAMEVPGNGYHIYEAERKGIIDLTTGNISSPNVDRAISFADGIELGIIDPSSISVKDPKSGRMLNVKEALEKKIIEADGSVSYQGRTLNIEKAVEAGVIVIDAEAVVPASGVSKNIIHIPSGGGPVISFRPVGTPVVEESEQSWSFDSTKGVLIDHMSGERLPLERALLAGKIQPEDLAVRDALTGREMSFTEAEKWGIIDKRGYYLDKIDNKRLSFTEAAQQHRIYPTGGVLDNAVDNTLARALSLGWYNANDGMFTHPDTHRQMTLKEAIIKGLFNPYDTSVVDKKNNKKISLLEAIQEGIVDDTAGTVLDTQTQKKHDLNSALQMGILEGKSFGDSLESGLFSGRLDLATGSYTQPSGASVPLHEALKKNLVDQSSIVVRDPASGTEYSYHEAVSRRIVDPERGLIHNQQTNEATSFPQALTTGLIAGAGSTSRPSHTAHKIVEQKLQLTPFAPQQVVQRRNGDDRHEYVDLGGGKQVMVKVVRGEGGVEKGEYVDPSTGMKFTIQMHGVCNPTNNERIPIKRAIEMGIIDARTGEVRDPHTRKRLTWLDIIKSVYQAITSDGVFDPTKGQRVPVTHALNEGLIDSKTGKYHNPITEEYIELKDAVDRGLIDSGTYDALTKPFLEDYRTRQLSRHSIVPIAKAVEDGRIPREIGEKLRQIDKLNFAEALGKGLIDVTSNIFTDQDTGRQMTIAQAIEQGYIDTGNVEAMEGSDEKNLSNIINSEEFDENSGRIRDKRTSLHLTFKDAVERDVIDGDSLLHDLESNVEAMEGSDEKNLSNIINSEEFDENSGRIRDKRTSLHLTFKDAVERDVIDGDSLLHDLESGQTLTLREALVRRKIDSDGKYIAGNLKMTLRDAVKGGYKFKIENYGGDSRGSRTSVPKFREETIVRLTPQKAEPSLTVRMRHSQTNIGDRARSLIDDPSTLADLQHEFLANLEANRFDTDEKIITNPSGGQRLSVREAAETGLLDVLTGEIVVPDTGRRYSIPKAVHLNYVQGDAAKRLDGVIEYVHRGTKSCPATESVAREATIRQNELSDIISELARFQETIYSQHLSFDLCPETAANAHNDVQVCSEVSAKTCYFWCWFRVVMPTVDVQHPAVMALTRISKNALDNWRREVKEKLEAVDTLCFEEADSISPEQLAHLRERRNQLTIDYDNVVREVENLHGSLAILLFRVDPYLSDAHTIVIIPISVWSAVQFAFCCRASIPELQLSQLNVCSLLIEFSSRELLWQSWMTHQTRVIGSIRERSAEPLHLNEARQDARRLLDEITQEESRLKAIGAVLAKIEQEVDALYDSAPVAINRGIHSTEIRNTFNRVDDDFSALQKQCSELIQFQNRIAGLGSEHAENLRRVDDWFSKIEKDLDQVERGSDVDVEQKLVMLEGLNQQVVDGNVHIDHADQASRRLLNALDGLSAHPDASRRHEAESEDRRKRHSQLVERLQQAFNQATAQKAANEGVRDAVHDLCSWIDDFENRSCTNRDIPLIEEDLNQLKREEQMLRMDLDSRLSLTNDLENDLKKLAGAGSPGWVEDTEQKLRNAVSRLQKNSTELRGFRDNVNDALEGVIALEAFGIALDRSCDATSATLRTMSARDDQGLNEIASELEALDSQLTDMMRTAETIKKIPNVTETQLVDRVIRNADEKLHNLNKELNSKYSTQEEVGRLENDFEDAKQRMADWISQFDAELLELKPVSIDHEKLTEQRGDQLALLDKHKEG